MLATATKDKSVAITKPQSKYIQALPRVYISQQDPQIFSFLPLRLSIYPLFSAVRTPTTSIYKNCNFTSALLVKLGYPSAHLALHQPVVTT